MLWLCRWWRSMGFGVHSPFAFRFIRAVLRNRRNGYYAYPAIDAAAATRRERLAARRAYRVAAALNPAEVVVHPGVNSAVEAALCAYKPASVSAGTLEALVDTDGKLLLRYLASPKPPVVFESPRERVAISLPELWPDTYRIYFK